MAISAGVLFGLFPFPGNDSSAAVQPPDALVRIMAVWDPLPVNPDTRLLFATALVIGADSTSTYLLANASSIANAQAILVMEGTVLPEEAKLVAVPLQTNPDLDLVVLAVRGLQRPAAQLSAEPATENAAYTSLAFVHKRNVPLSLDPQASPTVAPPKSTQLPDGPPWPDIAHGSIEADGALLNSCGHVIGWHVPAYAFPGAAVDNGLAVSGQRIIAWLARARFPYLDGGPCPVSDAPMQARNVGGDISQTSDSGGARSFQAESSKDNTSMANGLQEMLTGSVIAIVVLSIAGLSLIALLVFYLRTRKTTRPDQSKARSRASELIARPAASTKPESSPPDTASWRFEGRFPSGRELRFTVTSRNLAKKNGSLLIGRDSTANQVVLDDDSLSRIHARLIERNGQLAIEDLDSTNGVFVNDVRLGARCPTPITGGSRIRLGAIDLSVMEVSL